jgi:hypothetical protein
LQAFTTSRQAPYSKEKELRKRKLGNLSMYSIVFMSVMFSLYDM